MIQTLVATLMWALVASLLIFRHKRADRSITYAALSIAIAMTLNVNLVYTAIDPLLGGTNIATLFADSLLMTGLFFLGRGVMKTGEYRPQLVRAALSTATLIASLLAITVAFLLIKRSTTTTQFMKDEYPDAKQDLYGAFVVRGVQLAHDAGLLAIVVGDTWMSIKSFEALRLRLLRGHAFDSFVHMRDVSNHPDIFGANAAFVLSMVGDHSRHAPFIRLTPLGSERKEQDLRVALAERTQESGFHLASGDDFAAIPGSPIVYWLSEKMRGSFATGKPLSEVANLRQGLATADNARFLRQWWEVSRVRSAFACTSREEAAVSGARWFPYNKGGEFRKWYGNQEHVVNWENDGAEIVAFKPRSVIRNPGTYFSPSVSWSDISSGEAAFRRYPSGFLYANTGHSGFSDELSLDRLALLLNSTFVTLALRVLAPTMHFDIGYVGLVPVAPGVKDLPAGKLAELAETSQTDWDTAETSWGFSASPLVPRT